ncbi:MAG: HAMP domain-containing protein [Alphaproteobacteria bacterium]|nr:HAMP domain-containing protein [Alphaproteobacteria bacterium]
MIRSYSFLAFRRSLSAKLIGLTVLFVLIAEAVVLVPSIAYQRTNWLNQRIEAAYIVGLALDAPNAEMIDPKVARQLFATANILGVTVSHDGANVLVMAPDVDPDKPPPMHYIDLRGASALKMIADSWATMFSRGDDMVRVIGVPAYGGGAPVGIIVSERAIRLDLQAYARRIFMLSLFISTLTALLVFWRLDRLIVRPVRRLSRNMTAFQANPDDPQNIIAPCAREDEIGVAERSLAALEERIYELLSQRRRLAALGAGISKISHDLRNILASAQLMADRLAKSEDPRARKLPMRLIQSLDRAIALSRDTLSYSRMEPSSLDKTSLSLRTLVEEALEDNAAMEIEFVNETPADLVVVVDRNQLYRALFNLVKNAVDAFAALEEKRARRVAVRARRRDDRIVIDIVDNAGGVPDDARAHLFEPFRGSSKSGGSGLGLAIAHEIAWAHGGALTLAETGPSGTVFRLTLPA